MLCNYSILFLKKYKSDGDSSITKWLNETLPYGNDFLIKKVECRNHLLRNFTTKLTALTKNISYPIVIRKFIKTNILRFRSDITKAISFQKSRDLPFHTKISGFQFNNYLQKYPYY